MQRIFFIEDCSGGIPDEIVNEQGLIKSAQAEFEGWDDYYKVDGKPMDVDNAITALNGGNYAVYELNFKDTNVYQTNSVDVNESFGKINKIKEVL